MKLIEIRRNYHEDICKNIIRISKNKGYEYPNFADSGNNTSINIAWEIFNQLRCKKDIQKLSSQTIGDRFEIYTQKYLEDSFNLLGHLRPGKWKYLVKCSISDFEQYAHLASLEKIVKNNRLLATALGSDYIVKADIVIGREPVSLKEVNNNKLIIRKSDRISSLTPLLKMNYSKPKLMLHASISCKWTIRSDRSQNTRTEALNLIRNRKGNLPHIVSVTAEPLPTRIASLALGTGDMDCVYHFALPELKIAIENLNNIDQHDILNMMIDGKRLRDISDLPFDLSI